MAEDQSAAVIDNEAGMCKAGIAENAFLSIAERPEMEVKFQMN